MDKTLHIISLDIPYPPDYGGVIDIFYKLQALHALGIKIILHCFQYHERKPNDELDKYCKTVYYYPRLTGFAGLELRAPYIVASRKCQTLLDNLLLDNAPILFEGIHTTYFIHSELLKDRTKMLRTHNIESEYYKGLSQYTNDWFKRTYYIIESLKLEIYEKQLSAITHFLHISEKELAFFKNKYPSSKHQLIPAFHPFAEVNIKRGFGKYCLYHGHLGVAENIKAATYLAKEIFSQINIQLIIAGKKPSSEILRLEQKNVKVIANPDQETLASLIQEAQIQLLPIFQDTGIKLKVVHALFSGRHCLVSNIPKQAKYGSCLQVASTNEQMILKIQELMQLEFTQEDIELRKKCLAGFENANNASGIVSFL